jgi:hypothetical protein
MRPCYCKERMWSMDLSLLTALTWIQIWNTLAVVYTELIRERFWVTTCATRSNEMCVRKYTMSHKETMFTAHISTPFIFITIISDVLCFIIWGDLTLIKLTKALRLLLIWRQNVLRCCYIQQSISTFWRDTNTLPSNTINLGSSFNVEDPITHPYKTKLNLPHNTSWKRLGERSIAPTHAWIQHWMGVSGQRHVPPAI